MTRHDHASQSRCASNDLSRAMFDAQDGSERLFNAMAQSIERLARAKRVSFDEAAVMAQNGVGL